MSAAKNPVVVPPADDSLYDRDFFEWTQTIAEQLLRGSVSQADLERVAEEIADMGKRDRREVHSRMVVLIMHLIKWAIQPERRDGSTWLSTINQQRLELGGIFEQSPSLRRFASLDLPRAYSRACKDALAETGSRAPLPEACPYTIDQILDDDWFPSNQ
jgi:hypothetical protein